MKRWALLVLVGLALLVDNSAAEPPAGVVLYFKSGGEIYLLLAEHTRGERGWAAFGGGGREGETLAETAAHKGEEESRGYYKRSYVRERIGDQKPVMDGEFAAYFAEVDFAPAQAVTNHTPPENTDAYNERSTFAWIPYSSLAPHLTSDIERGKTYEIDPAYLPQGSRATHYWRAWLSNMRKAVVANSLPW